MGGLFSSPKAPKPLPTPAPQAPVEEAKLETGAATAVKDDLKKKTVKKRLQIPTTTSKTGGVGLGKIK